MSLVGDRQDDRIVEAVRWLKEAQLSSLLHQLAQTLEAVTPILDAILSVNDPSPKTYFADPVTGPLLREAAGWLSVVEDYTIC